MTTAQLTSNVSKIAHELGFSECRVAEAKPAAHAAAYQEWVAEGCHGDMAWMAKDPARRTNPCAVLPGARSVIVLATNYFQGTPPPPVHGRSRGTIARYAWGDDYHDVIEKKLRDLDAFLSDQGGTQRCYVDTGPVLERDFANESGIGWSGKSTVQIHPRLGTWFFLSEILTTLALTPSARTRERCGSCTRCISACPTGAITRPHHVDARLCISYLTIEHKGAIPEELRPAIGDRIYGCDDCLSACPWNRFAEISQEASFHARDHLSTFSLTAYLDITEDEFRSLFRNSPIKRTKRTRFLRNVCVALGNVGTREDLPALEKAADSPEPLIAEHARWAAKRISQRHHLNP